MISNWHARFQFSALLAYMGVLIRIGLAALILGSSGAHAITGLEPNNTCATAQDLGALGIGGTMTVDGALTTPPARRDVDYYKVRMTTPGDLLHIALAGRSNGSNTLSYPMMAVLNSSCQQIQSASSGDPVTLTFKTLADGIVILAVTSCCDYQLVGTGYYAGTYSLALTEEKAVQSISGQLVDASTSRGIPNMSVDLLYCQQPTCPAASTSTVAYGYTNAAGQFTFTSGYWGPLEPGTYVIRATDYDGQYLRFSSNPVAADGGSVVNLGDLRLTAAPTMASIGGRIVDAVTRAPLSGTADPHTYVTISGCSNIGYGCRYAYGYTDAKGRFAFTRDSSGRAFLADASYSLYVSADQYQYTYAYNMSPPHNVPGSTVDVGDVMAKSNPIRFAVVKGCDKLSFAGGRCEYRIRVTNGTAAKVRGASWATMSAYGLGSFVYQSTFQTDELRHVTLESAVDSDVGRDHDHNHDHDGDASRIVRFDFRVPASLPTYASVCPTFWFGSDAENPQLNVLGAWSNYSACLRRTANGVDTLSDEDVHRRRTKAREHEARQFLGEDADDSH